MAAIYFMVEMFQLITFTLFSKPQNFEGKKVSGKCARTQNKTVIMHKVVHIRCVFNLIKYYGL